jgi:hypothetical protein
MRVNGISPPPQRPSGHYWEGQQIALGQRPIHDAKHFRILAAGERGWYRRVARELTET